MFDCHYDLLTFIYMKRNNINVVKKYCKKIFKESNITGGIFNLFYMSEKEMKDELNIPTEEINIIENLKEVNRLIKKYDIIPNNVKYIVGIEGLNYLNSIDDIDILYDLRLRSTNIVWNNENKFGGGSRAKEDIGLTDLGKELINKLISKKIAIDLSHTNEKTFYDIINECEKLREQGKDPIVFASHSNLKTICDVPRNLTDSQILKIKELGGVIGIVEYKDFCKDIDDNEFRENYELYYLKHINYVMELLEGIENISLSTDDMSFYDVNKEFYKNSNIYKHDKVKKRITNLLKNNDYSNIEIERMMNKNFEQKILARIEL